MWRLLPAFLLTMPMLAADRELVLVDTDSGPFGDDGAALVMLLRSPGKVSVSRITTVPGNVWAPQAAEYVLHVLDLLGRQDISVSIGADAPLVNSVPQTKEEEKRWGRLEYIGALASEPAPLIPAVGNRLNPRKPSRDAIQAIIHEIERHPGEVTVVALGPLTNIALALKLKPSIETKIKQIVFMGGSLKAPGNSSQMAEFNFWFDPDAARIVLRSRIPRKVMFPLDVCNMAPLRKAQFDVIAAARTPISDLYREDQGKRFPGYLKKPDVVGSMWDELVAAFLIDASVVTGWENRHLDVYPVFDKGYGATIPLNRNVAPDATPVSVATEIDFNKAFGIYRERLTRRD